MKFKGVYPEELLLAWDQFKELKPNLAENQRPSEYATEDQHFILFALANGGIDLESYKVCCTIHTLPITIFIR